MKGFILVLLIIILCNPILAHALSFEDVANDFTAEGIVVIGWRHGEGTLLFEKNKSKLYPIASITKLATALAAYDLYPQEVLFTVSPLAESVPGISGGLKAGESFTRTSIFNALLVESSNDASVVFAESVGARSFLKRMNYHLSKRKLRHTAFVNITGLDPVKSKHPNSMTPYGTALLLNVIYQKYPLLASSLSLKEIPLYTADGQFVKNLSNTNELFFKEKYAPYILLSKTGTTTKAKENLVMITKGDTNYDYYNIAILGSADRIYDAEIIMKKLYYPIQ